MNPDEIKRLHRGALNLSHKGISEDQIGQWLAANSQGAYSSLAGIKQAANTLPDNLLRGASRLAQKGIAPDDINAWLSANSGGQFATVQDLTQHLGAQQQAQRSADNPLSPFEQVQHKQQASDAAFASGLTSGFSDEAIAAAKAGAGKVAQAVTGQYSNAANDYRPNRDAIRALQSEGGMAPKIAGGIAQGLLTLPLLGGMGTGGYLQGIKQGAALGGAFGAAAGAGDAPELRDVPHAAAQGGLLGGVGGAALSAAAPLATGLYRAGKDWLGLVTGNQGVMRQLADRQVGAAMNMSGGEPAFKQLDQALSYDLPTPIAADVGGPARRALRVAVNKDPSLEDVAANLADARVRARASNLATGLEQQTGLSQADAAVMRRGAAEQLSKTARQIYAPLDNTILGEDTQVPMVVRGLMQHGEPAVQKEIANITRWQPTTPLDFQTAQSIQAHLDKTATRMFKSPDTQGMAVQLADAAKTISTAMKTGVPGYLDAQAQFRMTAAVKRGSEMGRKMLNIGNADDAIQMIRGLYGDGGQPAVDALRKTYLEAIANRLRSMNVNRSGTAVGQLHFMSDQNKQVFRVLFPDDNALTQFQNQLALAKQQGMTESRALQGSKTSQEQTDAGVKGISEAERGLVYGPHRAVMAGSRRFLETIMDPQNRAVAGMIGRDLMAPYSAASRTGLIRQMELDAYLRARQGLLANVVSRSGIGGGAALLGRRTQ